ncbi:hypothetical protein SNEBB_003931 [Seison nebaliae]|nr:hypothetical protein SNEBB_003931 [Seison nebaliae]
MNSIGSQLSIKDLFDRNLQPKNSYTLLTSPEIVNLYKKLNDENISIHEWYDYINNRLSPINFVDTQNDYENLPKNFSVKNNIALTMMMLRLECKEMTIFQYYERKLNIINIIFDQYKNDERKLTEDELVMIDSTSKLMMKDHKIEELDFALTFPSIYHLLYLPLLHINQLKIKEFKEDFHLTEEFHFNITKLGYKLNGDLDQKSEDRKQVIARHLFYLTFLPDNYQLTNRQQLLMHLQIENDLKHSFLLPLRIKFEFLQFSKNAQKHYQAQIDEQQKIDNNFVMQSYSRICRQIEGKISEHPVVPLQMIRRKLRKNFLGKYFSRSFYKMREKFRSPTDIFERLSSLHVTYLKFHFWCIRTAMIPLILLILLLFLPQSILVKKKVELLSTNKQSNDLYWITLPNAFDKDLTSTFLQSTFFEHVIRLQNKLDDTFLLYGGYSTLPINISDSVRHHPEYPLAFVYILLMNFIFFFFIIAISYEMLRQYKLDYNHQPTILKANHMSNFIFSNLRFRINIGIKSRSLQILRQMQKNRLIWFAKNIKEILNEVQESACRMKSGKLRQLFFLRFANDVQLNRLILLKHLLIHIFTYLVVVAVCVIILSVHYNKWHLQTTIRQVKLSILKEAISNGTYIENYFQEHNETMIHNNATLIILVKKLFSRVIEGNTLLYWMLSFYHFLMFLNKNIISIMFIIVNYFIPSIFRRVAMFEKYDYRSIVKLHILRILLIQFVAIILLIYTILQRANNHELMEEGISLEFIKNIYIMENNSGNNTNTLDDNMLSLLENRLNQLERVEKTRNLCWENQMGERIMSILSIGFFLQFTRFLMGKFKQFIQSFMSHSSGILTSQTQLITTERRSLYHEFIVAEMVLSITYDHALLWLGTLFAPGIYVLYVFKLEGDVTTQPLYTIHLYNTHTLTKYFLSILLVIYIATMTIPIALATKIGMNSNYCGPFRELDHLDICCYLLYIRYQFNYLHHVCKQRVKWLNKKNNIPDRN